MKKILLNLLIVAGLSGCGLAAPYVYPDDPLVHIIGPTKNTAIFVDGRKVGTGKATVSVNGPASAREIRFDVPGCEPETVPIRWRGKPFAVFWVFGNISGKGLYEPDPDTYKSEFKCRKSS